MKQEQVYPASVFWSDEDEGFIALAPDLPGCSAFGDSREEALKELEDAITAWIEASLAAGNAVPPPSNPAADVDVSGRYLLRMPKSLHFRLIQDAKRDGVSLNSHITGLLTQATARAEVLKVVNQPRPWKLHAVGSHTFGTQLKWLVVPEAFERAEVLPPQNISTDAGQILWESIDPTAVVSTRLLS